MSFLLDGLLDAPYSLSPPQTASQSATFCRSSMLISCSELVDIVWNCLMYWWLMDCGCMKCYLWLYWPVYHLSFDHHIKGIIKILKLLKYHFSCIIKLLSIVQVRVYNITEYLLLCLTTNHGIDRLCWDRKNLAAFGNSEPARVVSRLASVCTLCTLCFIYTYYLVGCLQRAWFDNIKEGVKSLACFKRMHKLRINVEKISGATS